MINLFLEGVVGMKIRDILSQDRVTVSFEVFPHKAGLPLDSVMA